MFLDAAKSIANVPFVRNTQNPLIRFPDDSWASYQVALLSLAQNSEEKWGPGG